MVIDAFRMIARGRQYLATMAKPVPLQLSLRDIGPYLDRFEPPLPEQDFIRVVMSLDDASLQ